MTKLEYSSCSGPSYTDLLPQASAGADRQSERDQVGINVFDFFQRCFFAAKFCKKFFFILALREISGREGLDNKKNKHKTLLLTLHLDHFGHVCAEEGINPLRLSVSIHVQLDVCRQTTGKACESVGGGAHIRNRQTDKHADRQTPAVAGQIQPPGAHVPGAGRTASGGVGRELAAKPVAVEVGGGMVGA